MIDISTYERTVQDEHKTENAEKQLIPLPEKESNYPETAPPESIQPRRGILSRIHIGICALFCILTVTLTGITLADAWGRTSAGQILLHLTNRAFLGLAHVRVTEVRTDIPPLTPVIPNLPGETDTPAAEESQNSTADTETESAPPDTGEEFPIAAADLTGVSDIHALSNETPYEPDTETLLAEALPFLDFRSFQRIYGTDAPYILIIHTHGTESFAAEGTDTYTSADTFRSTNTDENIVAVGAVIADTFEAAGIPVLHCTEMFDAESYNDAYSLSAAAVRRYLSDYPSIQIVLDVHRDSIVRADSTKLRPVTTVNGEDTAQVMIVVGTDYRGANHPDWQDNLSFALKIQNDLITHHDRLARAINLRGAGFNQQYTSGSLLLEIGSCGNTLSEAKRAGALCAAAIANTVCSTSQMLSDISPTTVVQKGVQVQPILSHGEGCTCDFCLRTSPPA